MLFLRKTIFNPLLGYILGMDTLKERKLGSLKYLVVLEAEAETKKYATYLCRCKEILFSIR
jgi:hypothetical protein